MDFNPVLAQIMKFYGAVTIVMGLRVQDGKLTLLVPEQRLSWPQAAAYCRSREGTLAQVENEAVRLLVATAMNMKGLDQVWIGASFKDASWSWQDATDQFGDVVNCVGEKSFVMPYHYGRQCFRLRQEELLGWYEAKDACADADSHLPVFRSKDELQEFSQQMSKHMKASGDFWIGFTDSPLQREDGKPVMRTFWEGGQPSRRGRCVQLERFGQDSYWWANQECITAQAFVCQLPTPQGNVGTRVTVGCNYERKTYNYTSASKPTNISTPLASEVFNINPARLLQDVVYVAAAFLCGVLFMSIPLAVACIKAKRMRRPDQHRAEPMVEYQSSHSKDVSMEEISPSPLPPPMPITSLSEQPSLVPPATGLTAPASIWTEAPLHHVTRTSGGDDGLRATIGQYVGQNYYPTAMKTTDTSQMYRV